MPATMVIVIIISSSPPPVGNFAIDGLAKLLVAATPTIEAAAVVGFATADLTDEATRGEEFLAPIGLLNTRRTADAGV